MDLCLYHSVKGSEKIEDIEYCSDHAFTHGAMSRLIYGVQKSDKKVKNSTKTVNEREGLAAELMLNISSSKHYSSVLNEIQSVIDFPVFNSLDDLMANRPDLSEKSTDKDKRKSRLPGNER